MQKKKKTKLSMLRSSWNKSVNRRLGLSFSSSSLWSIVWQSNRAIKSHLHGIAYQIIHIFIEYKTSGSTSSGEYITILQKWHKEELTETMVLAWPRYLWIEAPSHTTKLALQPINHESMTFAPCSPATFNT